MTKALNKEGFLAITKVKFLQKEKQNIEIMNRLFLKRSFIELPKSSLAKVYNL